MWLKNTPGLGSGIFWLLEAFWLGMISYHPQNYVIVNYISVIVNLCILYVETISQELSSGTQKTSIELLISLQTQMS